MGDNKKHGILAIVDETSRWPPPAVVFARESCRGRRSKMSPTIGTINKGFKTNKLARE